MQLVGSGMPLYDYECVRCDLRWESFRPIADRLGERCGSCGGPAHQFLAKAPYSKRFTPYYNHSFGTLVRSPGHLNRLNKEHGLETISWAEYQKFKPEPGAKPPSPLDELTLNDYRAGLAQIRAREGRAVDDDPDPNRIISDEEAAKIRAEQSA